MAILIPNIECRTVIRLDRPETICEQVGWRVWIVGGEDGTAGGDCPPGFVCDEFGDMYPVGRPDSPPCSGPAVSGRASGNAVVMRFADGSEQTRRGGSRSWRNNNPGNIRPGYLQGEIGIAGRFAIFSTEIAGQAGIVENLNRNYMTLNILEAVKKWAPPSENNTSAYQSTVQNLTGLSGQTPMNTLNQSQLQSVANAIRSVEGWRPGTVSCRR